MREKEEAAARLTVHSTKNELQGLPWPERLGRWAEMPCGNTQRRQPRWSASPPQEKAGPEADRLLKAEVLHGPAGLALFRSAECLSVPPRCLP